jgi:hypothetical protein
MRTMRSLVADTVGEPAEVLNLPNRFRDANTSRLVPVTVPQTACVLTPSAPFVCP